MALGEPGDVVRDHGAAGFDAAVVAIDRLANVVERGRGIVQPQAHVLVQRRLIALQRQSVEMFTEYEPGAYVAYVSPTPLLIVVAAGDHLTVSDEAIAAYERALQPKKLEILPAHFDAYVAGFDLASGAARGWFAHYLLGG